jgi:hypothetical protein
VRVSILPSLGCALANGLMPAGIMVAEERCGWPLTKPLLPDKSPPLHFSVILSRKLIQLWTQAAMGVLGKRRNTDQAPILPAAAQARLPAEGSTSFLPRVNKCQERLLKLPLLMSSTAQVQGCFTRANAVS